MGLFDSLKRGLERSREALNEVFYFGGEVDESFWEELEDTLVMGDMGGEIAMRVTDDPVSYTHLTLPTTSRV